MAEDRARSFMERYVVARAVHFRTGEDEAEDLWNATQMAKNAYRMIANVANTAEPEPNWQQPASMQAMHVPGSTGAAQMGVAQQAASGQIPGTNPGVQQRKPWPAAMQVALPPEPELKVNTKPPKQRWWGGNNDQSRKPKRSA